MSEDPESKRLQLEIEAWRYVQRLADDAINIREREKMNLWLRDAERDLREQARLRWWRRLKKLFHLGD